MTAVIPNPYSYPLIGPGSGGAGQSVLNHGRYRFQSFLYNSYENDDTRIVPIFVGGRPRAVVLTFLPDPPLAPLGERARLDDIAKALDAEREAEEREIQAQLEAEAAELADARRESPTNPPERPHAPEPEGFEWPPKAPQGIDDANDE